MSFKNFVGRCCAASAACLMVASAGALGLAAGVGFTMATCGFGVVAAPHVVEAVATVAYMAMQPRITQLMDYAESGKWTTMSEYKERAANASVNTSSRDHGDGIPIAAKR